MEVSNSLALGNVERIKSEMMMQPLSTVIREFKRTQQALENSLLGSCEVCSASHSNSIATHLSTLDSPNTKRILQSKFVSPSLMKAATCLSDAIFLTNPKGVAMSQTERVREWVTNLHQVGSDSSYGYALGAKVKSNDDLFIIKTAKNKSSSEDLSHELFVAIFGLNSLRSIIPNFMYIYGGFKCSPPVIDPNTKEVTTWCRESAEEYKVNYIVCENVAPAISFRQYLTRCDTTRFLRAYLQVLYALRTAWMRCDFTHYDLHHENILMRDLPQHNGGDMKIAYVTERDTVEYILADSVATVIDYGFSHIKCNGEHFGLHGMTYLSIFSDRSWSLHDAYKLLVFSLNDLYINKQYAVVAEGIKILRFFTQESLESIIKLQFDTRYALPMCKETNTFTLDDLLGHIRRECDVSSVFCDEYDSHEKLGCSGNSCLSFSESAEAMGLTAPAKPTTVFEAYDALTHFDREREASKFNSVAANFNFDAALDIELVKVESIMRRIVMRANNIRAVNLVDIPVRDVLRYDTMDNFRKFVLEMSRLYDDNKTASLSHIASMKLAELLNVYNPKIERIKVIMLHYFSLVEARAKEAAYIMKLSFSYLDSIEGVAYRDKRLRWYWLDRRNVPHII